jgi:hypothetical protein
MSKKDAKKCPECEHEFKATDGMELAHWKAKHDQIMRYEEAWPLIKSETYVGQAQKQYERLALR